MDLDLLREKTPRISTLLKGMAHPERLMILCRLTKGEVPVRQLREASKLKPEAFAQHIRILKRLEMIKARKEAQYVYYSLADEQVVLIIKRLQKTLCCN